MGALADKARQNSNFILLEKGDSIVARYLNFRFVPNYKDPAKEDAQYIFSLNGSTKYWTNGNSKIMNYMDRVPLQSFVRLSRDRAINKDGSEAKDKSTWAVQYCDEKGNALELLEAAKPLSPVAGVTPAAPGVDLGGIAW